MVMSNEERRSIVSLMRSESNFERSILQAQQCRSDSAPRQGELSDDIHARLVRDIARDAISYVIFSYRTPIAWVYRTGAVNLPEINYGRTTTMHQNIVREAYGDLVNRHVPAEPLEGDEFSLKVVESASEVKAQKIAQYSELAEDDLIELASELGERLETVHSEMIRRDVTNDLVAVVGALNERRKATAPSRARVGEYLRQHAIVEAKYRQDLAHYEKQVAEGQKAYSSAPKPIGDVLDEVRSDEYAGTARLRLTDLQRLVPTLVRDSQKSFEAEQLTRLGMWDGSPKVTEKQAALLPCIAAGHIATYASGSYSGKERGTFSDGDRKSCTCVRPDGRTIQALIKKGVVGVRRGLGYNASGTLTLKRPTE